MKLLLTTLLCLLLTGCAVPAETPTAPTEVPRISQDAADSLKGRYGSEVEAFSLPVGQVRQLIPFHGGLLLCSDNMLILLDADFQVAASCTLDFVPEIAVTGNGISAFDPGSRKLLLLDASLQEIRQLTLPSELSGSPRISSDSSCIYYCTDRGIHVWDLESGIRRRIRESGYENQILIGLHRNDTILQCRIRKEQQEQDLFLDAQSGQLLQELPGPACLITVADRYYCMFSSGAVQNLVYGSGKEQPRALFPEAFSAESTFLPGHHAAVTVEPFPDDTFRLTYYSLEEGYLQDTLTLYHTPKVIAEDSGSILLLVSENGQDVLLKWQPSGTDTAGKDHTAPYFTADTPDHTGLSLCRDYAERLSGEYGPEILIWKEAAAIQPWDYTFEAEYRYPVLLSQLQTLEHCLSRYPKEVLDLTASHFDSVKICLVQSIRGIAGDDSLNTATGIQFLEERTAHVVLAAGPYMEQALYHELFHVMETHILACSSALDRWNELNPAGFSYDLNHGSNARRNSGVYLEKDGRAFVDTYSMSFPREDRARIFEYAMLQDMEHLFHPAIMQQKLSALCTGIREAYDLEREESFPWEQYLE